MTSYRLEERGLDSR